MDTTTTQLSRRALLAAGATGLVAAALPSRAASQTPASQTPKRGGTLNLRAWDPPQPDPDPYFAAAGNAGSLPMSRMSCWMTTVAFRFATICFMRSIEATVAARSKLKLGTPPLS